MRILALLLLAGCPGAPGDDTGAPADTGTDGPVDSDDQDGDGFRSGDDCDDADPDAHPGAAERCNGLDDDCDGAPAPGELDADDNGLRDCEACEAAGYWEATRALPDAQLEGTLGGLTTGLWCDYGDARAILFSRLDNEGGRVTCVYTGEQVSTSGIPDATVMNTEHSWPQSEGADDPPARCDLHHLYPTMTYANTKRAAHPFGEVTHSESWSGGGSRLGEDASGDIVFEPRDAHKGNVARSMLYFALEYGHSLGAEQVDLFLAWHAEDPTDAAEIDRTLEIAERQAFANPLVACPDLASRLYE